MTLKNQHFPIGSTSSNGGSPPKINQNFKKCCLFDFFPHKNGCVILMIPVTCCRKGSGGGFCPNHFPRLDLPRRSENFRTRWPGTFFRGGTGEKKTQRRAEKITRFIAAGWGWNLIICVWGVSFFFLKWIESGQITIFHQPRFPWNKGDLLNNPLGWGRVWSLQFDQNDGFQVRNHSFPGADSEVSC